MSTPSTRTHGIERTAHRRRYLMCRPTEFDVVYSINPWMDPSRPTDPGLALAQWDRLRELYEEHGHEVLEIEPLPGLPDMVFTANGATVAGGRALVARFRHAERAGEESAYVTWFAERDLPAQQAEYVNEGEGDYLVTGRRILAGAGFRSDPRSHDEVGRVLGLPVSALTLVDPRFYHLDTAACALDDTEIMYYPGAFSPESLDVLRETFPDALLVDEHDAVEFALNAVSDGFNVFIAETAEKTIAQLRERGYRPVPVDLSELKKSGGGVKCCTLELRGEAA